MRIFGWVLLIGGLLWALIGLGNVYSVVDGNVKRDAADTRPEAVKVRARDSDNAMAAGALILNGMIFIFPGLVVAGIGGLLAKRRGRERTDDKRIPCPSCAELIMSDAKVCRFCGRDVVRSPAFRLSPLSDERRKA